MATKHPYYPTLLPDGCMKGHKKVLVIFFYQEFKKKIENPGLASPVMEEVVA
jgi:hypothetical protein